MRDLELAKEILKKKNLSLVMVKGGKPIFESHSSGISGLLQAIDNLKEMLHGSFVADRVVGRAAALLLTYSCVKKVCAVTLSSEGLRVLVDNNIKVEYGNLVPKILDKEGKNICPFEKFSLTITSPTEAYEQLKVFAENIRK
jgi:hypothetical protein